MKKMLSTLALIAIFLSSGFSQEYQIPLGKSKSEAVTLNSSFNSVNMLFTIEKLLGKSYTSKTGQNFTELYFGKGYSVGESGSPKLPAFKRLIQIPLDAEVVVNVINFTEAEYDLNDFGISSKLYPVQPSPRKDIEEKDIPFEYNEKAYLNDSYQYRPIAKVEILGTMRGVKIARVEVFPVDYNPVSGTIKVYNDIEVEIAFKNVDIKANETIRAATYSPYFDHIFNKSLANSFTKGVYEDHPDLTDYPVKMLIISHRMFEATLAPFIEWKTKKGFFVDVAYTDVIGTTNTAIQTYIHGIYNSSTPENPAPTFLVFVGDVDQVPASTTGSSSGKKTDLYYGSVDGDYFPEMYYGRMSATTTTQLQNIINKVLYYEQYQFADPTYLNKTTLIAGADGTWNPNVGQPTVKYGTRYYFRADQGYTTVNEYGVTTDPNNPAAQSGYTGCYDPDRIAVGFINYTAHCSETGWADPSLSVSNVNALTNANKYPLAIGNCCLAADFGYGECAGEAWIRGANKGAVTYIGSSPSSYWFEDFYWSVGAFPISGNNNGYVPSFEQTTLGAYDAPQHSDYVCASGLVFVGNLAVTEVDIQGYPQHSSPTYYWQAYNVLGDPSIIPHFTEGESNEVSHMAIVPIGLDTYTVEALTGSYVAISKNGVLHGAAIVGISGSIDVPINPILDGGNVDVVVTRPQTIPYMAQVPAAALEGPYIVLDSYQISDPSGNGNGQADFGESFTINVTLKNVGADPGIGITASLIGTNEHFSVTASGPTSFGNIPAGETGNTSSVNSAFSVTLSNDVPDQYSTSFTVVITDGDDSWESNLTLTANAPKLSIGNLTIDDAAGNSDGVIDPGETVNLIVAINNIGAANVGNLIPVMTILNGGGEFLTLNSTTPSSTTIAEGSSVTVTFNVTADGDTPLGTAVDFQIDATAGNNNQYSATGNKQVIIGFIPEYCESHATSTADSMIDNIVFGEISNDTSTSCATYSDFTDNPDQTGDFLVGESYNFSITLGSCGGNYNKAAKVYFDWNYDGDFTDVSEMVYETPVTNGTQTHTTSITIPTDVSQGQKFMRVVCSEDEGNINPCGTYTYGETEDYKITIIGTLDPEPDFTATPRTVELEETVTFTDASQDGAEEPITSWSWDFGSDAVPATATGQGPHAVHYASTGAKTVSLTVNGSYTETKASYITVTKITPTVTWPTASGIDYGEALSASTLTGGHAERSVTPSIPGTFAFTNPGLVPPAGAYAASVTFTPSDGATYTSVVGTVTVEVEHMPLTVGGTFTVSDREYDGTNAASIENNNLTLFTPLIGDDVALVPMLAYASADAANGIGVTLTGDTHLTGADAANYLLDLTGAPASTGDILPREVEVTADDQEKVFDSPDPDFTYTITSGSLVGDDAFSGALTRDAGEDVGTYAITQGSLDAGSNYDISFIDGPLTITPLPITVTADDQAKVYGDADPSLTYSVAFSKTSIFTGELSREPGEGIGEYAITQGTLEADANYAMTFVPAALTISPRPIEVTADDLSKEYGEDDPAFTHTITAGSLAFADVLTGELEREAGEAVGDYPITQGDLTVGGNYDLTFVPGTLTITERTLTITALDLIKAQGVLHTFEGTEFTATGLLPNGVDEVSSATLTSSGAAAAAALGAYAIVPSAAQGAGLDNYAIAYVNGTLTVSDLTELTLTGLTADDRAYDGTTGAAIVAWGTLQGMTPGDDVALDHSAATAAFLSRNAGNGKEVRVSGLALTGADAGDYFINPHTVTADITPKALTVGGTFTAPDRVYDGTTGAAISQDNLALAGVIAPDQVELSAEAAFASKGVGTGKTVSLTADSELMGLHAANYSLSLTGAPTATADISALTVGVTGAEAQEKAYDGNTVAAVSSAALAGAVPGDMVTLANHAVGTFAQALVGEGIAVATAMTLTGADAGNYALEQPIGLSADITLKPMTISGALAAEGKTYDGTTAAVVEADGLTLTGTVAGEVLTLTGVTAVFAQAGVGPAIAVTLTAAEPSGATAANYSLSLVGAPTATASITARELTLGGSFTALDKEHDGTPMATIDENDLTLVGEMPSDGVVLTGLEAEFGDAEVGEGKTVTLTAAALEGADSPNYSLSLAGAPTATASITAPVVPQYTLTLTLVGAGAVEVDGVAYTAPLTADGGTELELEALADEGWRFEGWSVGLTGNENPATITLTADVAITVTFTETPEFTLTLTVVGSGSITVNGEAYSAPIVALEGTELTLDAEPAQGWGFDGWTGDLTGDDCPVLVPLTASLAVTATFSELTGVGTSPLEGVTLDPNPFSGTITLRRASLVGRVVITSLIGQRVLVADLGGAEATTLITSGLPRGVYLITLEGLNGLRSVRKLVKE